MAAIVGLLTAIGAELVPTSPFCEIAVSVRVVISPPENCVMFPPKLASKVSEVDAVMLKAELVPNAILPPLAAIINMAGDGKPAI